MEKVCPSDSRTLRGQIVHTEIPRADPRRCHGATGKASVDEEREREPILPRHHLRQSPRGCEGERVLHRSVGLKSWWEFTRSRCDDSYTACGLCDLTRGKKEDFTRRKQRGAVLRCAVPDAVACGKPRRFWESISSATAFAARFGPAQLI